MLTTHLLKNLQGHQQVIKNSKIVPTFSDSRHHITSYILIFCNYAQSESLTLHSSIVVLSKKNL